MKQGFSLRSRSNRRGRHAQGFSLLEILLVLGIAAALIIAAFVVYPKVQAANRAQAEAQNIAAIAAGARALYASSASYATVNNTVLLNAKVFPDSMVSGTNVTNVWGGAVTAAPSTAITNGLKLTEANVPQVECTKIAASAGANFTMVTINGTVVKSPTVALDPAAVATQCSTGGAANTMIFEGL